MYDEDRTELRVLSEFWAPRELNQNEITALLDDTRGQWSDGIGAACFDQWEEKSGVHLDLSPSGRSGQVVAHQVEDGRTVPRFAHLPKAYWKGKVEIVQQAVSEKADLNALYDGSTTLCLALQKNDVQTALMLIAGGAEVNLLAPLVRCASLRESADAVKIARALLLRGADVNARDASGTTPLQVARQRQWNELVELLVASGAKD